VLKRKGSKSSDNLSPLIEGAPGNEGTSSPDDDYDDEESDDYYDDDDSVSFTIATNKS
jgi:hypothetical protein